MITISVRSLPRSANEESVTALFSKYGVVRSVRIAKDIFSGECKGFATIEMEGHEAREAIAGLAGTEFDGRNIRVGKQIPRNKRTSRHHR